MRRLLLALLAVLLVPLAPSLCGMAAALAAAGDVPGSKDYPGIGRFIPFTEALDVLPIPADVGRRLRLSLLGWTKGG